MSYTKDSQVERIPPIQSSTTLHDSFQGKANTFRTTLFPTPLVTPEPTWRNYKPSSQWNWAPLSVAELQSACSAKIKGKTPGPDHITQDIILHAYKAIPDVFYRLYSSLLNTGYHPKC